MALDSFNVYYSYLKALEPLSDAECGRLLRACLIYCTTGEVIELRGNERILFPSWQSQIDRDRAKYEAKCKRNSQIASMRWDANACERMRTHANDAKDKDKDKDKDKKEKTPTGSQRKVFVPPTVEQVAEYCQQRNNGIDPAYFVDWYAARGWTYGKGKPIVDWKAAVRTWEHKDSKKEAPDPYDDVI